jgi:dihydrolipoamide dehydrogenase
VRIASLEASDGRAKAVLEDGKELLADRALVSVGRRASVSGLGLDTAGVELDDRGFIKVGPSMLTSNPRIFAIGDVTGGLQLAHVASAQAEVAVKVIEGSDCVFDGSVVPSVVFTTPELAQVGLREEDCRDAGIDFITGRFSFAANGKALASGEGRGTIKLIAEAGTGKLLGGHILGPHASDIISEVAVAIKNNLKLDDVCSTIHTHPTLAEVVHEAAEAARGTPLHQM